MNSFKSYGHLLEGKQKAVDPAQKNYGYIEYFQKSLKIVQDPSDKEKMFMHVKLHEARREFSTASLRQINHLIQIDAKPNLELTEPKWELYKISISFQEIGK